MDRNRAARRAQVLGQLRCGGAMTVSQLATATDLSRPTVASLLDELQGLDVVQPDSAETPTAGRPASRWILSPAPGIVIGLDILPASAVLVSATLHGRVLTCVQQPLPRFAGSERLQAVLNLLVRETDAAMRSGGPLLQICVSTTGIISRDGVIQRTDLVPEWTGLPLQDEIERHLVVPVSVHNDVNLAALGEFHQLRQQHAVSAHSDVLLVRLARGLHTGLVLDGQIRPGASDAAGEVADILDLTLEGSETPSEEWVARAGLTVASVAAVVDPAAMVLAGPTEHSRDALQRLRQRLQALYERTGGRMPSTTLAQLGWAASVVGATHWALDEANRRRVGSSDLAPVEVDSYSLILQHVTKGSHTVMEPTTVPSDTELTVGVVGVGARSRLALNAETEDCRGRITTVCDPHPEVRRRVRERLDKNPDDLCIRADLADFIRDSPDVAFITSPDDTHADITCALLESGIACYLEKPLAIHLDDATRILETAHRTGTKLYLGHNMRHMNVVRTMRQLIREGRIGEVKAVWCRHFVGSGGDFYFKDWHATQQHGNGLLLQKAAHDIDVIHWLTDSWTTEVVGMGGLTVYDHVSDRADHSHELMSDWYSINNWPPLSQKGLNPTIDVEDLSMMLMRLESGVMASYQQCHYTPDYWRNYTVIGTEGRIENFGDGEGGVIRVWNKRTNYNPDGDLQFPIVGDSNGHGDADVLTVKEFFDFVRHGRRTDTSPVGAWRAVAAGILATESLRDDSTPRIVPKLDDALVAYFDANQTS